MNENFSIVWGTRQIRYKQLLPYVGSAIKHLKGMGIEACDRVAICDENSIEYVVLLLALWQIKAVAAPVNPRWPDKTIASYAAKIKAGHLFRGPDIKRVICYDARQHQEAGTFKELDPEQEVTIIATSGSSGEAKAALHTWGNHFYSAKGSQEIIPLLSRDRWLLSLPLYHVSGMAVLARCLISGAGLAIAIDGDLMGALDQAKATHVSLVPTQLQRFLEDEKNHALLRALKCILLGGSGIPATLIDSCIKTGLNVYLTYGLTEMSSQVATGRVSEGGRACVKILPYRQVSVSPDGEILVRGEVLFRGYAAGEKIHLPLVASSSENNGLWFPTGDMGEMDQAGCLSLTGRRDSMFISGGENIYPEEIEKALLSIPGIAHAVVVPKDDREFGQRPVAFIKFSGGGLEEDDLVRRLEAELPRFKIPSAFFPWPQHLMTQGMKISRQEFLKVLSRR
jgi:O-succinylbenzoic acid--CoA ligase